MNTPSEAKLNHQYKGQKQKPTLFETYLKYSTEKEVILVYGKNTL